MPTGATASCGTVTARSERLQTGIGPVEVARAKMRDRGAAGDGERIRFTSAILPRWARRTRSLDALLPVLYLRGVSTGDFQEALAALLGKDAPNLSPSVIARLTARVGGRLRALAAARSVGAALRLRLGRRRLPAGAHGATGRVHAGADRRDAGGQEGTGRLPGRRAGERAELAGAAGRPEGARLGHRARKLPSATARSASGRRSRRSFPAPGTSAAGCTRPSTCSTSSRSRSRPT